VFRPEHRYYNLVASISSNNVTKDLTKITIAVSERGSWRGGGGGI